MSKTEPPFSLASLAAWAIASPLTSSFLSSSSSSSSRFLDLQGERRRVVACSHERADDVHDADRCDEADEEQRGDEPANDRRPDLSVRPCDAHHRERQGEAEEEATEVLVGTRRLEAGDPRVAEAGPEVLAGARRVRYGAADDRGEGRGLRGGRHDARVPRAYSDCTRGVVLAGAADPSTRARGRAWLGQSENTDRLDRLRESALRGEPSARAGQGGDAGVRWRRGRGPCDGGLSIHRISLGETPSPPPLPRKRGRGALSTLIR